VLVVIAGPMFSGKTTELIRLAERQAIAGRRVIAVKPSTDVRYDPSRVVSHSGRSWEAVLVPPSEPDGIREVAESFDVIAVDELHFFDPRAAEVLNEVASEKLVIAAGLNLDYRGIPFEATMRAMAYADRVISLAAVCRVCGRPATRTQRLASGGPRILVGGSELYEARCRRHHRPE